MFTGELRHDRIHLAPRALGANVILESSNALDEMRAAAVRISRERERPPDIHAFAISNRVVIVSGMLGASRHDANHRKGLRVHRDLAADDLWVAAKTRSPHAVTEDYLKSVARNLCLKIKLAPQFRLQAEDAEISGGDAEPIQAYRFALTRQLYVATRKSSDGLERMVARSEVKKVKGIERELWILPAGEKDPNQPVRFGVREPLQQHTVNHAEYRTICPDAERQRHNHHQGKGRIRRELPEGILRVLQCELDESSSTRLAAIFLHLLITTKRKAGPTPGLLFRDARLHVLLNLPVEVEPELFIQLPLHDIAAKYPSYSKTQIVKHRRLTLLPKLGRLRRSTCAKIRFPAQVGYCRFASARSTSRAGCSPKCPSAP